MPTDLNDCEYRLSASKRVSAQWSIPVLVSTHPRTRKRIEDRRFIARGDIRFHEPFGFHDYNSLQLGARCVLSDSGTISEESSILGFPPSHCAIRSNVLRR